MTDEKSGGIYQIINQIDGKRYIGSAVNLSKRRRDHFSALCRGAHSNPYLQAAFNKYGESSFTFAVLEYIENVSQLILREQHFLDTLNPKYNLSATAGSTLGLRLSLEARTKISRALTGRPVSEETRLKISLTQKGKHLAAEHRKKLSQAAKGKHLSGEHRRKISEYWTPERRQAQSVAVSGERNPWYGKHLSAEHRARIGEAQMGERNHTFGKHPSEETRRKLRIAQRARRRRERAERQEAKK